MTNLNERFLREFTDHNLKSQTKQTNDALQEVKTRVESLLQEINRVLEREDEAADEKFFRMMDRVRDFNYNLPRETVANKCLAARKQAELLKQLEEAQNEDQAENQNG